MDRKEFLVRGCHTCFLGATAILLPQVVGCGPTSSAIYKTVPVNNQVSIPLQLFDKSGFQIVKPQGLNYNIAVRKTSEGGYSAVLMRCTHMDNALTYSQNSFNCSLHGSRFSPEGEVLKGPAEIPLKKYKTAINNDQLIISI